MGRRFLADRRRATAWWALGMAALVATAVGLYPAVRGQEGFEQTVESLPDAVKGVLGTLDGVSILSPAGYLNARLFATFFPLVLLVFGIGLGARAIAGAEEEGLLEPVLANPVSRLRVAVERYATTVLLVAALLAVGVMALLVLAPSAGLLDGVSLLRLLRACGAVGSLGVFHASVAFAVGLATGRRSVAMAVPGVVAVAGFVLQGAASTSDGLRALRSLSTWHWFLGRNALVDAAPPASILAPLALGVALVVLAARVFEERDLRQRA